MIKKLLIIAAVLSSAVAANAQIVQNGVTQAGGGAIASYLFSNAPATCVPGVTQINICDATTCQIGVAVTGGSGICSAATSCLATCTQASPSVFFPASGAASGTGGAAGGDLCNSFPDPTVCGYAGIPLVGSIVGNQIWAMNAGATQYIPQNFYADPSTANGDLYLGHAGTSAPTVLADIAVGALFTSGGVAANPGYNVPDIATGALFTSAGATSQPGYNVPDIATGAIFTSAGTTSQPGYNVPDVATGALFTSAGTTSQPGYNVADVATGSVLTSAGTTSQPAYSANPNVTSLSTGTNPASTFGTGGGLASTEGTGITGQAATDDLWADGTNHAWTLKNNNGTNEIVVGTSAGVAEGSISDTGELGVSASTAGATLLVACQTMVNTGHLTTLGCTTDLSGTCTTAPTFGTRDTTSTTNGSGTVACGSTAGVVTQSTPGLSFTAGDQVCLTRTVNGASCLTTGFAVGAHYSLP